MKEMNADIFYDQACQYLCNGEGISYEKGVVFLRQAAVLGHIKAQYNLGICLHQGMGLKQSHEEAFKYFNLAAEQGHPLANYMMGCYFAFGWACLPSEEHAADYFRIAAEARVAEAQYNLGVLLLEGKDIQKSVEEAFSISS